MRRPLLIALALLALLVAAAPAGAASRLSAIRVAQLLAAQQHAYVQPGVRPKPDAQALRAVASQNSSFYLVILQRPLRGTSGAQGSARRLLQALKRGDPNATVGLVLGDRLAGASLKYPKGRIAQAVADTGAGAKSDPVGVLTGFTQAVAKPNLNPSDGGSGSGGGRPFWQWLLVIAVVVGIALGLLRLRARSNEQRRRRRGGSIWTAREFHLDRLEALAARHAALTGETMGGSEDPEALDHLQTAGARILALRRTLPQLASPRELRAVATELDAVEWEILWVEHRAGDQAPPPPLQRAFPGLCFFSHEHGLGTEAIELRKPDGTIATVWVSPENRLALERGDVPDVSMVHVGSRMVPWPTAPSWYGAYGWTADDLPGLEYGARQIWGIDGPEREPEPADSEQPPAAEQPAAAAEPTAAATATSAEDGELSAPDEGDVAPDDATAAWAGDDELDAAADPFAAPVADDPFGDPAGAPADGEDAEQDAWAAPAATEEPAHEDEPAPAAEPASAPPTAPASGFEELDEPAPAGLVEEEPVPAAEPSEELFPAPPAPPELGDDEATLDGAGPAPLEGTAEWDPFRDDDARR